MPQSTAGSLKPIAVQQVTAPPLSEDARDASSEIEYKIPI